MSAIYFALGVVAKVNEALWRKRINFVPINVLVLGGLIMGGFGSLSSAKEGSRISSTPVPSTIEQVQNSSEITQNYVTISGVAIPEAVYVSGFGRKGAGNEIDSVMTSWYPLVDPNRRGIILVEVSGELSKGEAHEATVTGMLREINSGLRKELNSRGSLIEGIPIDTRYVLVDGARPGSPTADGALAAGLFGTACLFVIATLRRNTIFQRKAQAPTDLSLLAALPLEVKATGTFSLHESGKSFRKRFINVPAVLGRLEDGDLALLANVDASHTQMFWTTSKMAGIWVMPIADGSVRQTCTGLLYWGFARRHALRFSYTDGHDQAKREAVIAVGDEALLGPVTNVLASEST